MSAHREDPNDPRVIERDRNRKLLRELNERHNAFVQECDQEMAKMKREFESMRSTLLQEHNQVKTELQQVGQEKAALHGEVLNMRNEMQRMKNEFRQMTGKMHEVDKNTSELKKGLHSKDEIVRLESKTGLVMQDLRVLTKQLFDRGVLMPPKPEEPPEEDKPPVGTIELDEDVFTARLMLKLGFMRQDAEARSARREAESFASDFDSDEEIMELDLFDNVQGLMLPEVEPGQNGYTAATWGWLGICVLTAVVQWLIMAIMVTHGLHSDACFEKPPDAMKWWLLHTSKAFAMIITGIIMGKELMGIINYFMVSELLEPARSKEVCVTTIAQGALTCTVVAANVFIFLGLTNPVDVWTNMAALGFIASLDAEVLEVAKGGILGHAIAKSLTPLNYQLTFVSHYPSWFNAVRGLAVVVVAGFIALFTGVVFLMPDPMCH